MDEYLNNEIGALIKAITSIANLDDETLDETLPVIQQQIDNSYTPEIMEQAVNQLVENLEKQRLNREEANLTLAAAKNALYEMLEIENFSDKQKEVAEHMLAPLFDAFNEAVKRYHLYNIKLPIKLEEGAQAPTYAHDTDAAADIYALENTTLQGNTKGNKIRTGVSIQLPEGWLALIIPRSSIGAKTPLRLSNSVGLIDSGYRGELGVLYDNTSEVPYEIKAGDRIAQLLVMPSYRFMPKVVDTLEDSDRGEGGFGSTGA